MITVTVHANLPGLVAMRANLTRFSQAILHRVGREVVQQNVNEAMTQVTTGSATPRLLSASNLGTRRGISVPRTTASGRPSRDVGSSAGRNYDWQPLPLNKPATLRAKSRRIGRERGGSLWSLLDEGILLNPERYTYTMQGDFQIAIGVPPERVAVLPELRKNGYNYWGMPRLLGGVRPSAWAAIVWERGLQRWAQEGYRSVSRAWGLSL